MATGDEFESRVLDAGGHRIHCKLAGTEGPLVLLCHGFPESWYSWRHQMPALADAGYRVAAMDMRGYGRSSKPHDVADYRITELVADCVGVVRALGEEQAVIVGHDWGALVAWTAAWTRPDVFRAVAGLSVAFGARGQMALPGDPWGDIRPSIAEREMAGSDDKLFYQEYFNLAGHVAERHAEQDLRGWVTDLLYSFSASPPLPEELQGVDLTQLPDDAIRGLVGALMSPAVGAPLRSLMQSPADLPDWLPQEALDHYVTELEYAGLTGGLNYYRNLELNWEILGAYQGTPVSVPALFIGGNRDVATIWARESLERSSEVIPDLRGKFILDSGHWIQQEQPEQTNAALLEFLRGL
jgi:pimeloyl-ACP methyl ester carboxylesterase